MSESGVDPFHGVRTSDLWTRALSPMVAGAELAQLLFELRRRCVLPLPDDPTHVLARMNADPHPSSRGRCKKCDGEEAVVAG